MATRGAEAHDPDAAIRAESVQGKDLPARRTSTTDAVLSSSTPATVEECAYCYPPSSCPPLPCAYGGCIFNKTDGTNALVRSGSCSGRTATLHLSCTGIASVPAGVFDDIAPW